MARGLRILIVDDHAPFRRSAAALLSLHGAIEVVGEASSGDAALRCVDETSPGVVLLDVNMPRMSGIEVANELRRTHPDIVVVLCSSGDVDLQAELDPKLFDSSRIIFTRKDQLVADELVAFWERSRK